MFKTVVATLAVAVVLGAAGAAAVVYSGEVNVAADEPHAAPVEAFLRIARERSVAQHSRGLDMPELNDVARIQSGAGNYQAMCVGCHLAPGVAETELSQGLSPTPPNLSSNGVSDPARAFWIIKHGIKSTGMPAWGKSMPDEYIWSLVAFIRQLPAMDEATYRTWVASSGGHSHGGGEHMGNHHDAVGAHGHGESAESPGTHAHGELADSHDTHDHDEATPHAH